EERTGLPENAEASADVEVAVLRLPGLSNFTHFAALARAPGVAVRYVSEPGQLRRPDLIVLPGTRTTVRALGWLRSTGLAEQVRQLARAPGGPFVLGVCGGLQMLGRTIADPEGVESDLERTEGLGWLDIDTRFEPCKTLGRVTAEVIAPGSLGHGAPLVGYEIHQGTSQRRAGALPWLRLRRQPDGAGLDDGAVS